MPIGIFSVGSRFDRLYFFSSSHICVTSKSVTLSVVLIFIYLIQNLLYVLIDKIDYILLLTAFLSVVNNYAFREVNTKYD